MLLIVHGVVCMNRLCCKVKVTQQLLQSLHALMSSTVLDINACNDWTKQTYPKQKCNCSCQQGVLSHNYNVVLRDKDHNIMYQIRQSQQGSAQLKLAAHTRKVSLP